MENPAQTPLGGERTCGECIASLSSPGLGIRLSARPLLSWSCPQTGAWGRQQAACSPEDNVLLTVSPHNGPAEFLVSAPTGLPCPSLISNPSIPSGEWKCPRSLVLTQRLCSPPLDFLWSQNFLGLMGKGDCELHKCWKLFSPPLGGRG